MRLLWHLPLLFILTLHHVAVDASPRAHRGGKGAKNDSDIEFVNDRMPIVSVSPVFCWRPGGYTISSRDIRDRLERYVAETNKEEDGSTQISLGHSRPVIPLVIEGARYYNLMRGRQHMILYLLRNVFAEVRLTGTVYGDGVVAGKSKSLSQMGIHVHSSPFGAEEQPRHGLMKQWLQDLGEENAIDLSGTRLFQLMGSAFKWDTFVPINPVENTLVFIVGQEDTDISIKCHYQGIQFARVLLFIVGATLLTSAPKLSRSFTFQLTTESFLGTLVGFIVLGVLLWRKATLRNSLAFGMFSLLGSMIPTMYGKWANIGAALWSMEWWQWLLAYAIPSFLFLMSFFYIWGPITGERPLKIITLTLRVVALAMMWLPTTSNTGFFGLVVLVPLIKALWLLLGAMYWYMCKKLCRQKRRPLSEEEYKQHVAIATEVGLSDLRNKIKEDFGEYFLRLPEDAGVEAFLFAFFGEEDVDSSLRTEKSEIHVDADGRRTDPRDADADDDVDDEDIIREMEDFEDFVEKESATPRRPHTRVDKVQTLHRVLRSSERQSSRGRWSTPSNRRHQRRRLSFSRRPGPTTPPADEVEYASEGSAENGSMT
eukprot:gb/GECG01001164.1/.p1 GENE.gb/GECG01001164.1/~~gb/GECG01001164.1/.p1  ORF type:complete len:597 (+),score=67.94 gb/GECG01001164.1/:1-1791(+)